MYELTKVNIMQEQLEKRVVDFVEKELAGSNQNVTVNTKLNYDLNVMGTEADDFMGAFGEEFDVDLSNLEFKKYFGKDLDGLLIPIAIVIELYYLIFNRSKKRDKLIPVKVKDLIKSAEAKKWVPPSSSNESN